jgi:hypothetical protein
MRALSHLYRHVYITSRLRACVWQGLLEDAVQIATRILDACTNSEDNVMDMGPLVVDARRVRNGPVCVFLAVYAQT